VTVSKAIIQWWECKRAELAQIASLESAHPDQKPFENLKLKVAKLNRMLADVELSGSESD
jgi:hypothetical protein